MQQYPPANILADVASAHLNWSFSRIKQLPPVSRGRPLSKFERENRGYSQVGQKNRCRGGERVRRKSPKPTEYTHLSFYLELSVYISMKTLPRPHDFQHKTSVGGVYFRRSVRNNVT